ncbi:MAG: hypothetical protein JWN50_6 [Parcubacteria group bacterium]|nr:hypothetical protein [Parcubacteria group bacterium]
MPEIALVELIFSSVNKSLFHQSALYCWYDIQRTIEAATEEPTPSGYLVAFFFKRISDNFEIRSSFLPFTHYRFRNGKGRF